MNDSMEILSQKLKEKFGKNAEEFLAYEGLFVVESKLPCKISITPENSYRVQGKASLSKGVLFRLNQTGYPRKNKFFGWGYSNDIYIKIVDFQIVPFEPILVKLEDLMKHSSMRE